MKEKAPERESEVPKMIQLISGRTGTLIVFRQNILVQCSQSVLTHATVSTKAIFNFLLHNY